MQKFIFMISIITSNFVMANIDVRPVSASLITGKYTEAEMKVELYKTMKKSCIESSQSIYGNSGGANLDVTVLNIQDKSDRLDGYAEGICTFFNSL